MPLNGSPVTRDLRFLQEYLATGKWFGIVEDLRIEVLPGLNGAKASGMLGVTGAMPPIQSFARIASGATKNLGREMEAAATGAVQETRARRGGNSTAAGPASCLFISFAFCSPLFDHFRPNVLASVSYILLRF